MTGIKVIEVKAENSGANIYSYSNRIYDRSDLTENLTHLTRPTLEELDDIFRGRRLIEEDMLDEINYRAVDRLIRILKDQSIIGSTTKSGFIIGPRAAACFQELPLVCIKENIDLQNQSLTINNYRKLRYCGVGIRFDRFYVYMNGGRPVIYEEKETAKRLLGKNEQEYWRIVNLELNIRDPYVENFLCNNGNPIITHELETKIIDWTHEREWRVPDRFDFNLERDFSLNNHLTLVFKNRKTYKYFLEQMKQDGMAEDNLFETTDFREIYKTEYLDKFGTKEFDEIEEKLGYKIYTDDFLDKLWAAKEDDRKFVDINFDDIEPNSEYELGRNCHIAILDELTIR